MCKTLSPTVTLGELMAEKMEIGYLREELALADAEIRRLTALDGHHILADERPTHPTKGTSRSSRPPYSLRTSAASFRIGPSGSS